MITIIDYENTSAKEIGEALQTLSSDFRISVKESDILDSNKLILPDSRDISSSIKKLHLLNLFSLLRITKKPILGIGTGMHLMTKSYKNLNAACLGCFPVECVTEEIQQDMVVREQSIKIIKETKLLKNIGAEDKFCFAGNCFIPLTEFTTSITKITEEVSVTLEKDYMFGVQFNHEKSGEAGLKILNNFLEI